MVISKLIRTFAAENMMRILTLVLCLTLAVAHGRAQSVSLPALRTNLLLPLLNVGAEEPIGNWWSVGADVYWPWIFRSSNHKNCFQAFGVALEGRYWLGANRSSEKRLLGHSIGAFAMSGYYDWERNYSGYQGDFVMGGIDYLYALPVVIFKQRMHLELSVGVGYFYSKSTHYQVFEDGGKGYRDKDFRKIFQYFGPLKAGVALVYPLK